MWFLPSFLHCLILPFPAHDMLLQRLKTAILVMVAAQKASYCWLGDYLHFVHSGRGYGGSKYQKMAQNWHISRQICG